MKKTTQAWLDAAQDDLAVIDEILTRPDLMVSPAIFSLRIRRY
jgi:hypothetical protein